MEGEVEAGEVGGQLLHAAVEPGQGGLDPAVVLQDEHDLEQRVASEGAGGLHGLDQVMEGEILVLVGGEVEVADPRDELAEGGMAGEIGAEDQGVDEEADEVLEGLVQSAGGGGSDGDVVAGAESAEEGGQSAWRTMNREAPLSWARASRRRCRPGSRSMGTVPPRWPAARGRR